MSNKKSITNKNIIDFYMNYVLEHNQQPPTVYAFAKANNFKEQDFYKYFGSFQAVEEYIFKAFFDNTIETLHKSNDYEAFETRNKLLSFYFTFFENLTANRSYVKYALSSDINNISNLKQLSKLKHSFTQYIEKLGIELIETKQNQLDKIQKNGLKESAWIQLLLTLKFWMDDTSASFERTDIFIEKSVNTSFDVLNVAPIKSLIDFGKFIFKEKVQLS
ncbi:TetR/AcrR family transcriptional regulator [Yeosuana sp. MJ-SS3]|uniref:TetR/AcrR family transcriptional regulator n=1 Tax=Gilvirhabdus luticola TaxID=3079858 RepID=A0ABU3U9W9_9FLAO|nr:TetR/AcrR family transcriptional regulator [Yeosuana sp. MJ-SS3]MDU8886875.1 TetR/AcrR family transcriptional regulator [Yeosuana sp. MJ-SS3]